MLEVRRNVKFSFALTLWRFVLFLNREARDKHFQSNLIDWCQNKTQLDQCWYFYKYEVFSLTEVCRNQTDLLELHLRKRGTLTSLSDRVSIPCVLKETTIWHLFCLDRLLEFHQSLGHMQIAYTFMATSVRHFLCLMLLAWQKHWHASMDMNVHRVLVHLHMQAIVPLSTVWRTVCNWGFLSTGVQAVLPLNWPREGSLKQLIKWRFITNCEHPESFTRFD